MMDNSVSVSTAAAQDAHTRRVATSRLHGDTNAERRDINETVDVMEKLNSDAANKTQIKTLYKTLHLGALAANRLAASAAESSLDNATPSPSDDNQHTDMVSTSSDGEAAAAAAGARRRRGRERKARGSSSNGTGCSSGGGGGGGLSGSGGNKKIELRTTRVHNAGRRSRTDRYAAAVAKG